MNSHLRNQACRLLLTAVASVCLFCGAAQADPNFNVVLSYSEPVLQFRNTQYEDRVFKTEMWDDMYKRIEKRNMPFIEVTNTSDMAASLTQFQISIAKDQYEFEDEVLKAFAKEGKSTDVGFSVTPVMDGTRVSAVTLTLDNPLAQGELFRFQVDLDVAPDFENAGLYPQPDYRMVFFDINGNDISDNSVVTATFEGMGSISRTLPDFQSDDPIFSQADARAYEVMDPVDEFDLTIPEPSAVALSVLGLSLLPMRRRRLC